MPNPKIQMKDVHKAFGSKPVLNGLTLDIHTGESIVIIGGSGTGKSVTIKCIQGILHPDSGSIKVDSAEVTEMNDRELARLNEKMGMLFQGGALFDSLTVWENVAFGLMEGEHIEATKARPMALDLLHQVGLSSSTADLMPAELSGGMQKRVSLARAIATKPEIIFFDEPTTGLDPIMSDVINGLIVKCVKELGSTAITITHDLTSARKIADRIAMLYEGKIIWSGTVKEMEKTTNPYVKQFINGQAKGPIKVDL